MRGFRLTPLLILLGIGGVAAPGGSVANDGHQRQSAAERALSGHTVPRADEISSSTYSQWFEAEKEALIQCLLWQEWLPTIGEGFTSVTWHGSEDLIGVSCTDPVLTNEIANGMRTGAAFSVDCDGHNWTMCDRFDGELWLDPPVLCDGSNCPDGYMLRPCFASAAFWGAVDGPTCGGAPSQQITVEFN
ncbi:MAG: hypothetical protein ACJAYU_001676 [Bradymonadia bacterium]|jgi:hypothetical protein